MSSDKPTYVSALITLFGRNWITAFGGMLAAASAFLIVAFLMLGLVHISESPYIGIMAFLILPIVFVAGLLLVPVGALWARFRGQKQLPHEKYPILNLNNPHTLRAAILVILLTGFNLLIIGTVSYKGVEFMDSVTFCGTVCHTVMKPEYTAYLDSPHLRVACVRCHIGPGAPWFVRSKISGMGQVLAVATHTYPRPIPSPVENLRPSRDTCEQCHWPEKFTGDRVKVIDRFSDDDANTPIKSVLLMHVGGGGAGGKGIHSWHIGSDKQTYYKAVDRKRQKMAEVRVVRSDGAETVYRAPDGTYSPEELAGAAEERMMDCIDCHNRPTHIFKMPDDEVDAAMAANRIDPGIPYIKKIAVDTLKEVGLSESALQEIDRKIRAYYQENHADFLKSSPDKIAAAVTAIQNIYNENVFPTMNLTWGEHPNNIGHDNSPGCFRCHDDVLQTAEGKTIGQDCEACHKVLAWDEHNPEILKQLGLASE